ncbi:MAG: hypothetical protein ACREMY_14120, partial [bacterium]
HPSCESAGGGRAMSQELPEKLAIDGRGFVWRVFAEHWSMAPSNPDNEPIPEPITYYLPEDRDAEERLNRLDDILGELRDVPDEAWEHVSALHDLFGSIGEDVTETTDNRLGRAGGDMSWRRLLCRRRVHELERGIARFLAAYDGSDMSLEQAAIAHLRHLMEEI